MTHQPSARYFEEPEVTWEKLVELLQQAENLRRFVAEGKIEHFAREHYSPKQFRKIVATMDKGTAERIITEAEKLEEQAADMRAYLEWISPKQFPVNLENASTDNIYSGESE